MKTSLILSPLIRFLLFLALLGSMASGRTKEGETPLRPVPTAIVQANTDIEMRRFPGVVRAFRRVDLAFNVPGQLEFLSAVEGTEVKQGDLLARLDPRDYQYNLDAAQADFQQAESNYQRKKKLYETKVISSAEFDQTTAIYLAAKAQLDRATKAVEDTVLYAPFNAVIAKRHFENLEQVDAKVMVVSLQDITDIEVTVQVPEILMATGRDEDLLSVLVNFHANGGHWYDAEISEWETSANPVTRTYDVVVKLPSPEGLNTYTGMTATVKVEHLNRSTEGSTRIPIESIFPEQNKSFVWVIPVNGGHPEKRNIVLGSPRGSQVQVLSGLEAGEHIAVAGIHSLSTELQIRPSKPNTEGLEQ